MVFSSTRTQVGMKIRAGVDDKDMLAATGVNVHRVFAIVFASAPGWRAWPGWWAEAPYP